MNTTNIGKKVRLTYLTFFGHIFFHLVHQKVKNDLEKRTELYVKQTNNGRKNITFESGDWLWLHIMPERFPTQKISMLAPRGDGPFKILEKINDNAYCIDLPGEFQIASTFNVTNLTSFDASENVLRSKASQERGNDEDKQLGPNQTQEDVHIFFRSKSTNEKS